MRRVPLRVYALVAGIMFSSFFAAMTVRPAIDTWVAAGVAAVLFTAVSYSYLEHINDDEHGVEEMFE